MEPNTNRLLMIRMKDRRRFFTQQQNLPSLAEFAKAFRAEIAIVNPITSVQTLDLTSLAQALCELEGDDKKCKVEVVEWIYPSNRRRRTVLLTNAMSIQEFIRKQMLAGNAVSLKELKNRFGELDLTDSCLCNHFAQVRKRLVEQGLRVVKVGAGKYSVA